MNKAGQRFSEPLSSGAGRTFESHNLHPLLRGARAVLFDVGGTLVHPDWQRLARLAEEEARRTLDPGEMRRTLCEALRAVDAHLLDGREPPINTRRVGWLFHNMYSVLGLDESACERLGARLSEAHTERHLWCGLDADAPRVLSELKRAGLRTAAISNTEDGRAEELLRLVEISGHFEFLIDSHLVGCRKPEAAIFQLALERLGLAPHEAVYVGDSYGHDVFGAERAGVRAILLDPLDLYREIAVPRIGALGELIGEAPSRTSAE